MERHELPCLNKFVIILVAISHALKTMISNYLFVYDFRYGACIPFSLSPTLNFTTLCEGVYQKGKDYVYISKQETADYYVNLLNVIGETEYLLRENFADNECTDPLLRMICHYYLPPCGNSTHFEPPTSVCEAACELQSEKCQIFLENFQQTLKRFTGDQLNCSTSILDPLPHSCSNLGLCKNQSLLVDLSAKNVITLSSTKVFEERRRELIP